ncbi:A disintegrin and metalloproteinase with thrombospondin motifs 12 isoform X1 [Dendroctonus ponderosae]|uniref:A disintegrin and metalloproteinase with thrombospondin motifs 12 isoform X1 n=1 Tax=Dendroctonus ponderosae TaxID=77166 RepID=UPI0020366005|nr:A disintegrin and metalloproteinase with thrombospondin motifs 12 isoform X1 [Dendroctonus ponderosae]
MINLLLQAIFYQCLCEPLIVSSRIHGRYTKSLSDFHLSIPHKLAADGKFSTFHLPHFHDHRIERYKERRKRSLDDPEMIHYGVDVNGHLYHLELWPNREFIHPGLVFEKRDPEANIKERNVRSLKGKKLCHYTGKVRGYPNSKAAISTCDGLAGYIVVEGNKYFIEPVDEHSPNFKGHHLHVVHNKVPKGTQPTCGTKESWDDAMKKRLRERALSGEDIFKEKRESENINRYLEMGIVCDKSFLKYHKQRDVELYVLTIMNMVADYYHDSSVGHQMDIVVVRIIYLEKEEKEIDLEINRDSGKTLKSFCDWANKINTPENTPNHFDMAMLLTRYDLCAQAEEDCDLTGLAFVGGACSKAEQCGINEDGGLVLSVIVAHEIGHLMGAEHDEQSTPCPVQDTDGSYFVMSPIVSTYTIRWSSCSRSLINTLIQNNLAQCLSDIPESTLYPFTENMPGVVYDANEQCKFMLPASLGVCSAVKEKICENLICKVNKKECIGKNDVAADGTKCAENKWCFKKKCIEMGARPEAVNGGWGDFGAWSECTRSCGGGISSSERECNNPVPSNRGRFCIGERRKLKICNPGPCPENAPTFRQQQCTEQNSKPWNEAYHSWTASFQEKEPCALYCVSEEHVLSKLEAAAKDGTPCKHGTRNMCISGVCRVVGCDNVLESESVEDRCGVCNGDGTQCKIVEETYKDVGQGYTKVVVIPAGARKIVIEENGPSGNIIAITDSSEKKFYLNGDDTEALDGECNIGTSVGIYRHVEPKKETLIINGPLKEDVVLFVDFFEQNNPGYVYKWAEQSVDSTYEPRYHWEIGEFEECSVACGGGSQSAKIDCIEEKAGKVSMNFCAGLDRPKEQAKNCNEQPCKRTWKVGPWSQCRACENKGGVRSRHVECLEDNPKKGAEGILLEDDQCEGPKPGSVELCEAEEKCGHKRMISPYIPGKYQGQIWEQMNRKYLAKRNSAETIEHLNPESSNRSSSKSSQESSLKGNLGKMAHDFRPLDEQIIMKYTIQPNPMKANLSDKADALMGDALSDVIDTEHKMVFKGKVAAKMKHQLEHYTNATLEFNCHKKKCIKTKSLKVKKNRRKPEREDEEDDVSDSGEEED